MAFSLWVLTPQGVVAQDTTEIPAPDSVVLQEPAPARVAQDTLATGELKALFSRIDELREVEVTVDGGVATLSGLTLRQEARDTAQALAGARDDVVYVSNMIEVESSLGARTRAVVEELRLGGIEWLARTPILFAALLIVVGFGWLARAVSSLKWLHRAFGGSTFAVDLTRRVTRMMIWLIGIVLALQLLDAAALVGALLGAAGVAGLAFGFAFRNIAENWLAGVLLSVRRPFDLDDEVSIDSYRGRVVRLTHSDTVLMTVAGNHLRIPNAAVYNGGVENYTRNPLRMLRFTLTIPRAASVDSARASILAALVEAPLLEQPESRVFLMEVGDSYQSLEVQAWVDQRTTRFGRARSLAYQLAKDALEASGIGGPVSEHTLHMGEPAPDEAPAESSAPEGSPTPVSAAVSEDVESTVDDLDSQVTADRERSGDVNLLT